MEVTAKLLKQLKCSYAYTCIRKNYNDKQQCEDDVKQLLLDYQKLLETAKDEL